MDIVFLDKHRGSPIKPSEPRILPDLEGLIMTDKLGEAMLRAKDGIPCTEVRNRHEEIVSRLGQAITFRLGRVMANVVPCPGAV